MNLSDDVSQVSQQARRRARSTWAVPAVLLSLVLLAVAFAQPSAGQGASVIGQAATPTPVTEVPEAIATEPYQPLGPHVLYVLDLNIHTPDIGRGAVSYVRVIDLETRQVLTIPARSDPNIALSPDRRYLYILDAYSTEVIRGERRLALSIYDLQPGRMRLVTEIILPPERTSYLGAPIEPELLLTPDGTRLYVLLRDVTKGLRILTVDTQTYQIVQDMATNAFCDGGWPSNTSDQLIMACLSQLTAIDVGTKQITPFALRGPEAGADTVAVLGLASVYLPERQRLYSLSTASGGDVLTVFDLANQTQVAQVKLDTLANVENAFIQPPAISPDGAQIYVGFRSPSLSAKLLGGAIFGDGSYLDQIGIFDASTGKRTGWINLQIPVVTFTLSRDGQTLYGASPQAHSLSLIDVASARIDIIEDVGETPVLVVPGQQ